MQHVREVRVIKYRGSFVADLWKLLSCASGLLALTLAAQGQLLNDWTNPASARWESASWSLGILPAANQTVSITNAGYKAVDIDSATLSGYPDSLTSVT